MRDSRRALPIPGAVAAAFEALSEPTRSQLLSIRSLVLDVAEATPGVGPLTETLKWGEPAYLTAASRSGSTIRLGVSKSQENTAAILFNCRTTLVETFRARFPDTFIYQGNRAILLPSSVPLPEHALDHDVFGWNPSKDIVIDSKMIEHDVVRKPVPTFSHHALAICLVMALTYRHRLRSER